MLVDFIEDQSIVVTAGHVCTAEVNQKISKYSEVITVLDFKGFKHAGYVIKSTENDSKGGVDMCALWVPTLKQKGITFSRFPPRAGQEIYYIGSPQGIYHPPVAPILTGIYSGQMNVSNALVSVPATSGSSGSAILDMNNKMVGVLWAAHEFHHVSIATSWHASALFLYEVTKMYNGKSKLKIGPIKN